MVSRKREIRQRVLDRDGYGCCYCGRILPIEEITLDHLIPDSQDGSFNSINLTIACAPCNRKRGAMPFWNFIEQFNFPDEKISKFRRLFELNGKIRVLNLAKEQLLNYFVFPQDAIGQACHILGMSIPDYDLSIIGFQKRTHIIAIFEEHIRFLESLA